MKKVKLDYKLINKCKKIEKYLSQFDDRFKQKEYSLRHPFEPIREIKRNY